MANEFIIKKGFISKSASTVQSDFTVSGNVTSNSFIVDGGNDSQFLKGDGTLDNTAYLKSNDNISELINDVGYITGFTNTTYTTSVINSTGDAIIRLSGSDNSIDDITLIAGTNTTLGVLGDTITINSEDTTYTNGVGLDLNGNEFRHSDTSNVDSTNNSGRTYIQNIDLDEFGHITGLTTNSETVTDSDDYVTGSTFNASTGDLTLTRLDGTNITQNLDGRYLTNETDNQTLNFNKTNGELSISNGNTVDLDGRYSLTGHTHVIADITDFPTDVSFFNNDVGYITGFTNTTYTNGSGLDLNGTEFSHGDTSNQTSTNNSGRTYIQNINLDTFGHITGLTTSSETVVNTDTNTTYSTSVINSTGDAIIRLSGSDNSTDDITLVGGINTNFNIVDDTITINSEDTTYTAGSGLDLNGTEFSHSDTSNVNSTNNSGRTYIQNIDLDEFGHITGLTTSSETVTDSNNYVTDGSFNASTGSLTLTRNKGLPIIVIPMDGRYVHLTGDTMSGDLTSTFFNTSGGLNMVGGNTNFRLYNNAGNDVLYMRDTTNSNMITTWGVGFFTVTPMLFADASAQITGNLDVVGTGNITAAGLITASGGNSSDWNEAHNWGDHALVGYLSTVDISDINATGTPNSSTYLRGDGTWDVISTTDTYITGATFNLLDNGILSLTRNDGSSPVTVDLDGRYSTTDTTYTAGTGLSLAGTTFNIDNPFNPNGIYSGLRAQATTAADVGLGNVPNWSSGTFDGRYIRTDSTNQSIGGTKDFQDIDFRGTLRGKVSASNQASQRADVRAEANQGRIHWYGLNDVGGTSNYRGAFYDGSRYINATSYGGRLSFNGNIELENNQYFQLKDSSNLSSRIHGINSSNVEYIGSIDRNVANTLIGNNTNRIALRVNNNDLLVVNNSGRVSVKGKGGDTVPGELSIEDGGSVRKLILKSSRSGIGHSSINTQTGRLRLGTEGDDVLTIDGTDVGIGTTNPSAKLEIEQLNSTSQTILYSNSYNNRGFRTGNSGLATFSGYQNGNNTGSGSSYGALIGLNTFYNGTNTYNINQYVDPASILFINGNIRFRTNDISTIGNFSPNERMIISESGNVGIGTINPSEKLEIIGNSSTTNLLLSAPSSVAGNSTLKLKSSGSGGREYNIISANNSFSSGSGLHFQNDDGLNVTFKSNGNVGIGTTSPQNKLHIQDSGTLALFKGGATSTNQTSSIEISNGYGNEFTKRIRISAVAESAASNTTGLALFTSPNSSSTVERLRIKANGNVGIGTNNPTATLDVNGTADFRFKSNVYYGNGANNPMLYFGTSTNGNAIINRASGTGQEFSWRNSSNTVLTTLDTSGNFSTIGDIIASSSSDKNLKENIVNIDSPVDKLKQLNGVYFDWIESDDRHNYKGKDIGVIAQEVEVILPEIVTTRENGVKAIQYHKLIPLTIEAIKEQDKTIQSQQKQLDNLQKQINELKKLIK